MKNNVMKVPKICEVCGKEYLPTSNRQRYCTVCGPEANIAIILRDVRLITIAPTFIVATIRKVLITIDTKQVQVAADNTQHTQNTARTLARYADVMVQVPD